MTASPTVELQPALRQVQHALVSARVAETLLPLGLSSAASRPSADAMLQCYAAVATASGKFGVAERTILQALDIEPAFSSTWWAHLITDMARGNIAQTLSHEISDLCARMLLPIRNFDRLASIIGAPADGPQRYTAQPDTAPANAALPGPNQFDMVLPAIDDVAAPLGRVAMAIEAVDLLGTVLAELHGGDGSVRLVQVTNERGAELRFQAADHALTGRLTALLATVADRLGSAPGSLTPQHRAAAIRTLLPIEERIAGRPDADRLQALLEAGIARLLMAGWAPAEPPGRGPVAASRPPEIVPPMMLDLATVIAEERRQLGGGSASPRRLWQADRPDDAAPLPFRAAADKGR